MRVIIISDMEGVSGIVKWEQVTGGEKLYEEGRVLYTEEINAAVRGAKRAGADQIVGETGINAALCGHFECPVVLVTGDQASCREGRELLGTGLVTVAVKESFGRFSARNIPPERARQMIEDGAAEALGKIGEVEPYDPGHPCEIKVEYATPDLVTKFRHRAGVE